MMSPRPPLAEPPDLRAALRAEPALRKVFSALAYTHQREHIEALLTAKKPETRARRLAKTLDMLRSDQPARHATNSARPTVAKMGLRAGQRLVVLDGDAAARATFATLPDGVERVTRAAPASCDVVVLYAPTAEALERRLPAALKALAPGGTLWVAYPKRSSGRATTLTRDHGWASAHAAGLRGILLIAFDDHWSGEKFRHE